MGQSNTEGGWTHRETPADHVPPAPVSHPPDTNPYYQRLQYSNSPSATQPTTFTHHNIDPLIGVRQDIYAAHAGERPSNGGQDIFPPVQSHNEYQSAAALSFAINVLVHRYASRQHGSDTTLRSPTQLPHPSGLRNAAVELFLDALRVLYVQNPH